MFPVLICLREREFTSPPVMVLGGAMYMLKWTRREVDEFHRRLILKIYYEFCTTRSISEWEAGWDTINRVGVDIPLAEVVM